MKCTECGAERHKPRNHPPIEVCLPVPFKELLRCDDPPSADLVIDKGWECSGCKRLHKADGSPHEVARYTDVYGGP